MPKYMSDCEHSSYWPYKNQFSAETSQKKNSAENPTTKKTMGEVSVDLNFLPEHPKITNAIAAPDTNKRSFLCSTETGHASKTRRLCNIDGPGTRTNPYEISSALDLIHGHEVLRQKFFTSKEVGSSSHHQQVSTELKLIDETWSFPANKNTTVPKERSAPELEQSIIASKLARMRNYSPEEEREEKRRGVSTKLKLYEDPWKIKKKLTARDVDQHGRLWITPELIHSHVLCFFRKGNVTSIANGIVWVNVWDADTKTEHKLALGRHASWQNYAFGCGWKQQFVNRRELKEGDEIALYLDLYPTRFQFCVVNRSNS